jgi:hypothetical protein
MTNQGHKDDSTWSRGQAWAIMGFAQVYTWTRDVKYLQTAIKCAEYFLRRLEEGKGKHRHHMVPLWDFDAPPENPAEPLRDVSAGVIAANGLLIIHQSLQSISSARVAELVNPARDMLDVALQIVSETLHMSYDQDLACFQDPSKSTVGDSVGGIQIKQSGFDAILRNSTTNWNEHAHMKYADHGLVYADYYLLEFGNKLLRAGLL